SGLHTIQLRTLSPLLALKRYFTGPPLSRLPSLRRRPSADYHTSGVPDHLARPAVMLWVSTSTTAGFRTSIGRHIKCTPPPSRGWSNPCLSSHNPSPSPKRAPPKSQKCCRAPKSGICSNGQKPAIIRPETLY